MLVFIVDTLEQVSIRLTIFHFKSWQVSFKVHFTIPYHISIVFNFVRTITLDTFDIMCIACKSHIVPFPAIFTLRNAWIHVCTINCSNMISYVKVSVNDIFGLRATLSIPYVNLD